MGLDRRSILKEMGADQPVEMSVSGYGYWNVEKIEECCHAGYDEVSVRPRRNDVQVTLTVPDSDKTVEEAHGAVRAALADAGYRASPKRIEPLTLLVRGLARAND